MSNLPSAYALTFHDTTFDTVEHRPAETWLRHREIAEALGYSQTRNLLDVYSNNAAEFTDSMTALVKLPTAGGAQEVRIFSLRGAHLLGMFARTERAAEFRRWVLDVLDHQAAPPAGPPLPPPVAADQVLDTLRRVIAERDGLRTLLAERMLKEEPVLRKVLYYYGVQGLTHTERARLMGWKTSTEWFKRLKQLAALGLCDYTPDPRFSAVGKLNHERQMTMRKLGHTAKPKPPTRPCHMRPTQPGQRPEVLHRKPARQGHSK